MPAQTPSASAPPTAAQRDKRRNRFFEAISTAPRTEQGQSSQQSKQQQSTSQSKPDKAHDAKVKQKKSKKDSTSDESGTYIPFSMSKEATALHDEATKGGPNAAEAVEKYIALMREEVRAEPNDLIKSGIMNERDFLKGMRATVHMMQEAHAHGVTIQKDVGVSTDFAAIIDKPRESLSAPLQKAQDALVGAEELRAKTDMPLSNDPKTSKRYINNLLRVNGEAPFPFDQLTAFVDPTSRLGRIVKYDLPARGYMMHLRARKPDLADVLVDMVEVYHSRATLVGSIKGTR